MNLSFADVETNPTSESTPDLGQITTSLLKDWGIEPPPATDEASRLQFKRLQGFLAHFALQPGFMQDQFNWETIRKVASQSGRELDSIVPSNLENLYNLLELQNTRAGLGIQIEAQLKKKITNSTGLALSTC